MNNEEMRPGGESLETDVKTEENNVSTPSDEAKTPSDEEKTPFDEGKEPYDEAKTPSDDVTAPSEAVDGEGTPARGFLRRNLYKILFVFGILVVASLVFVLLLPKEHTHTPGNEKREDVVLATCTEDGSYTRILYCTDCGEEVSRTKIRELALDHIGGVVTCTEGAVCTRCGDEYKSARGHINTESDCTVETECYFCSELFIGYHDLTDADCTTASTCRVCGITDGEPLGHTWVQGEIVSGERTDECSRCKEKRTVNVNE